MPAEHTNRTEIELYFDPNTGLFLSTYGDDKGSPKLRAREVDVLEVELSASGRPIKKLRRVQKAEGLLERMLRLGAIDPPQYEIASKFQQRFQLVYGSLISGTSSFYREPKSANPGLIPDKVHDAKRRLNEDIEAVGGSGTLEASVLWHCVGFGETLSAWAFRARVGRRKAKFYLINAISLLTG